jgi:hypothetical protein
MEKQLIQIATYGTVFRNVPPFIIQHALSNEDRLNDGLCRVTAYLQFWENYCAQFGQVGCQNMGLLPLEKQEATAFLDKKLGQWLDLWKLSENCSAHEENQKKWNGRAWVSQT